MADKTRSRRQWGTVITRRDEEGQIITYQARYVNPLDHSKKVSRNFGPDYLAEAYKWLDEEHYYVTLHDKGIRPWVHPSHREDPGRRVLFREYAVSYFDSYHKKDGTKLCGRSKRIVKDALDKLMPHFGDMEVSRITKAEVDKWYATASKQYKPGAFEHACNTLKRVLTAASKPQDDDSPALLSANPCNFPTLRKPSARRNQTPLTKDEIDRLVPLFPEYYRLCIRLSLLVGGLRIGEICGLQLRDIDLDHGLLYVRHSVDRGPADLGSYQLADVKTPRSNRVVPIPASAVAMIREHIEKFCPDREPGTMLFTPSATKASFSAPPPSNASSARPGRRSAGPTSPSTPCAPRTRPCSCSKAAPCARPWTSSATSTWTWRSTATSASSPDISARSQNSSPTTTCPATTPATLRAEINKREQELADLQDNIAKLRKRLKTSLEKNRP
jgi:integrase